MFLSLSKPSRFGRFRPPGGRFSTDVFNFLCAFRLPCSKTTFSFSPKAKSGAGGKCFGGVVFFFPGPPDGHHFAPRRWVLCFHTNSFLGLRSRPISTPPFCFSNPTVCGLVFPRLLWQRVLSSPTSFLAHTPPAFFTPRNYTDVRGSPGFSPRLFFFLVLGS